MQFILSIVLDRMVRFLPTVDVVLEEYNNCLPNNKLLGVNGELLMISSISNNTVSSSSK